MGSRETLCDGATPGFVSTCTATARPQSCTASTEARQATVINPGTAWPQAPGLEEGSRPGKGTLCSQSSPSGPSVREVGVAVGLLRGISNQ